MTNIILVYTVKWQYIRKKKKTCMNIQSTIRDRPFNLKGGIWFFVSFRIFFSDNTRVRILFFFCGAKRNFFFQNLTLGYMTKTLNHIFFFPPPKSEYFFQQHWESEFSSINCVRHCLQSKYKWLYLFQSKYTVSGRSGPIWN